MKGLIPTSKSNIVHFYVAVIEEQGVKGERDYVVITNKITNFSTNHV